MNCRCGHEQSLHHKNKDCTHSDSTTGKFCKCSEFREEENKGEKQMAKKAKSEGRTPALEGIVENPFKIYARSGGKDFEAQILKSGIIVFQEKEYSSPSAAGRAVLAKTSESKNPQVDGWKFWKMNKDGERVMLNMLRGSKSPLKIEKAKPKREKKTKGANSNGSASKPKRARKPRKQAPVSAGEASGEAAATARLLARRQRRRNY